MEKRDGKEIVQQSECGEGTLESTVSPDTFGGSSCLPRYAGRQQAIAILLA